jgi:ribosomal-protein-alanine acetyltransferase
MNAPSFTIRKFKPRDAVCIGQILRLSPEASPWSEQAIREFAGGESDGRVFLVSDSDGEVSGFLMARPWADEAEILNVAVLPAHRRAGQGGALLTQCFEILKAAGVTSVFLEVRESNAPAIAFYKRHGFTTSGRRPSYYRDPDEAALCMVRRLTLFPG